MHKQATRAVRKTTNAFPCTKSLPQKHFVSPEVFAEEQKRIFSKQWLLVGHQSQIANPGDYIAQDVNRESLIMIRDKDRELRGFFNVCRHRGTRLIERRPGEAACGHTSAIQCPYHAWTYGLDGRLIGAPHMDDVPGFDKADYWLKPVNLGIWEGFIFVNLAGSNSLTAGSRACFPEGEREKRENDDFISLEEWMKPLAGKFSHWNMSILRQARRIEYDVKANWKLMFENYSECYHCPGVHPQLQKVSPYDSAENDLTEGPFLGGFMKISPGKSLTISGNACALGILDPTRVRDRSQRRNAAKAGAQDRQGKKIENNYDHEHEHEGKNRVWYYSIFPNMLLSMHPEYVMVHQLWPQSPERTLIICDWLFHPEADRGGQPVFNPNDAIEFWDMTNRQDWHMCELSQQGISSRAYEPGPYSSRESIPAAWDKYYLRQMG